MAKADREKLIKLLDYWIEHNREHKDEFVEWAEKAKGFARGTVHTHILEAALYMDRANEFLLGALEELKGGKQEAV